MLLIRLLLNRKTSKLYNVPFLLQKVLNIQIKIIEIKIKTFFESFSENKKIEKELRENP